MKKLLLITSSALSLFAHASLSLTVDDLLADKNRFRLDNDFSYYNHHRLSVAMQGELSVGVVI